MMVRASFGSGPGHETPAEARERVCQRAYDCLVNGSGFEIMDANDNAVFRGEQTAVPEEQIALWDAARAAVDAWPDDLIVEAYVDRE